MTIPVTNADWSAVLPIVVLASTALLVLLVDVVSRTFVKRYVAIAIGAAGVAVAGILCSRGYGQHVSAFSDSFVLGGFTVVFEEIVLVATLGSLVLYGTIGKEERIAGAVALMLWSACGAMLMAGAASLMTIFLGLELLSLALYCLCGIAERPTSREAALKYLILSSTASALLLYGMALLFGATGSVQLADFRASAFATSPLFWLGSGMFFVGIAFKLSLVPFHTWAPDVYEGAPLPVTAFMSVATKAATLAVFARFIYAALPAGISEKLLLPMWVLAGISMIAGNVGMLAQTDLKRLLAFSGIAQIGYIMAALAGATPQGLRYALYYLTAYAFMNLGAFGVAAAFSDDGEQGSRLSHYRRLARRRPFAAAAMTVFLIALAGLPPTAGFLGKILILSSSASAGYAWLAALLLVGTAISIYAYSKIVRAMYEPGVAPEPPGGTPAIVAPLAWASVGVCAVLVVAMAFYPITPSDVLPLLK